MVSLLNNSTLGGTYNWTFAGGVPPTSNVYAPAPVLFNTAGPQNVTLNVSVLGCTNSYTEVITVNPLPDPNFNLSAITGCTPLPVTFNYTGIPVEIGRAHV